MLFAIREILYVPATDLLQRAGIRSFPRNVAEWQDAARSLQGALIEGVYCDWEARAKDDFPEVREFLKGQKLNVTDPKAKRTILRGQKNFPKNDKGEPQSKTVFAEGPNGSEYILYANLKPTLRGWGMTKDYKKGPL